MSISILTQTGGTVSATDDALLYNALAGNDVILNGVNVSVAGLKLSIPFGWVLGCGRVISFTGESVTIPSGAGEYNLIMRLQPSQTSEADRAKFMVNPASQTVNKTDINKTENGIYDVLFGKVTVSSDNTAKYTRVIKTAEELNAIPQATSDTRGGIKLSSEFTTNLSGQLIESWSKKIENQNATATQLTEFLRSHNYAGDENTFLSVYYPFTICPTSGTENPKLFSALGSACSFAHIISAYNLNNDEAEEDEHKVEKAVQIAFPGDGTKNNAVFRIYNNSAWSDWNIFSGSGDGADGGITAEGVRAIVSQDLLNAFESDSADEYSEYGSEISPNLPNPPLFMKCGLSADKNADLYKAFGDGTTLAYIMTITSGESNIAASRIQIAFSAGGGTNNKILSRTRNNGTVEKWSEWKTLTGGGSEASSQFQVLVTNKNGNNEVPSTSPDANLSGMDQYLCSAEVIRRRINAAVSGIDLGKGEGVIISYKGAYDGLEGVTYYPGDVVTCEVGKSYYYGSTGTFLCFKEVSNGSIQPPFGNTATSTDEDGNIVWLNLTYNTLQIPNNAENGQHIEIVKDSYGHISTKAVNKTNIKTKINLNITQSQWANNDTSPLNITVDKETYPHVYKFNWDGIYHDTPIAVFCQSEDVYKFAGTKTSDSYDTNAEVYIYSKTAADVKINMLVASIGDSE